MKKITQIRYNQAVLGSLLLLGTACARQVAPSGGPPDTTPPEIVSTTPAPGDTLVPQDTEVSFRFSERIDNDTFRSAVFISPRPGDEVKMSFSRNSASLRFPEPLLPDRTYVVTVGTDLKDYHGVAMAQSYTLAFSTGSRLDRGEISGRVYADSPQGTQIWAYILPDSGEVALDPAQTKGDYITQAGTAGEFRIPFIARGRYRVFAVNDRARDGLYQAGEDEIGVPDGDIVLDDSTTSYDGLRFRLTREDTLQPGLISAVAVNRQIVEARFDDDMTAPDSLWQRYFSLRDTRSGAALPILEAARFPLDDKVFALRIEPQREAVPLELEVSGLTDLGANPIDTAYAKYAFTTVSATDTARPRIVRFSPADSARSVRLDEKIDVVFNEWMQRPDSARGLTVYGPDERTLPGSLRWRNPFHLQFAPDSVWRSRTTYRVRLQPAQLTDLAGNELFDTLQTRVFTTLNADTLTSISGHFTARRDSNGTRVELKARQVQGGKAEYRTSITNPGPYRFDQVLPGVYMIEGFLDTNANGRFDFGKANPFQPAERFFVLPDSIKTRPRWPNEGNDIVID